MPVYHVVLVKLNPETTAEDKSKLQALSAAMVGQIPGLVKINSGAPIASTAHRNQGFNFGIVAVLEKPEDLPVYAEHEAHQKVIKQLSWLKTDVLAYDFEF